MQFHFANIGQELRKYLDAIGLEHLTEFEVDEAHIGPAIAESAKQHPEEQSEHHHARAVARLAWKRYGIPKDVLADADRGRSIVSTQRVTEMNEVMKAHAKAEAERHDEVITQRANEHAMTRDVLHKQHVFHQQKLQSLSNKLYELNETAILKANDLHNKIEEVGEDVQTHLGLCVDMAANRLEAQLKRGLKCIASILTFILILLAVMTFFTVKAHAQQTGLDGVVIVDASSVKIKQWAGGFAKIKCGSGVTCTYTAPYVTIVASGGTASPGGSNTYVQYNDAGSLGGDANFTWDKTNKILTIAPAASGVVNAATFKVNGSALAFSNIAGTLALSQIPTGGTSATFLRGDGTWATPSGGGTPCTTTANSLQFNNAGAFGCATEFTYVSPVLSSAGRIQGTNGGKDLVLLPGSGGKLKWRDSTNAVDEFTVSEFGDVIAGTLSTNASNGSITIGNTANFNGNNLIGIGSSDIVIKPTSLKSILLQNYSGTTKLTVDSTGTKLAGASGTRCLHTDASGYIIETSSDCTAGGGSVPLGPSAVWIEEDFLAGGSATGIGNYNWIMVGIGGTGQSLSFPASTTPHLGVIRPTTPATAGVGQCVCLSSSPGGTATLGNLGGNANWDATFIFKLFQTTATRLRIGFGDANGSVQPNNGIWLRYDTNLGDAAFTVETRASSVSTLGGTTYTVDTNWHKIRIWSTVVGTINFSFDGGATQSLNTNVPTTDMFAGFYIITDTTTAAKVDIDYFSFLMTGLSR